MEANFRLIVIWRIIAFKIQGNSMRFIDKQQLMIFAVAIVVVVGFVFVRYLPLTSEAKTLEEGRVKLLAENKNLAEKIKQLPDMYSRIEKVKLQVGDFEAKVPYGMAHGLFLEQIADIMDSHGLAEQLVQPDRDIRTDSLHRIPVNIQCKGDLEQIFEFFKSLEKLDRVVQIKHIQLANDAKYAGSLTMRAKIDIYYKSEAEKEI